MNSSKFRFVLFFAITLFISFSSHARRENRCASLFDIHLGYNAFINMADFSLGFRPNLNNARAIYNNFPKENEYLKQAGLFSVNYTLTVNHPPIEVLLSEVNSANGLFLSNLSLCSKSVGGIDYRNYYKKLQSTTEYQAYFYQTFLLGYPMYWDKNSIREDFPTNAADFLSGYDSYLIKANPTKSEQLLYSVFKLEIKFEQDNNEAAFLEALDGLVLANPSYFSVQNYQQFIKDYFPTHPVPKPLSATKTDSFDKEDGNPIYTIPKPDYKSFEEAVNALKQNPFDEFLASYTNVKKLLSKTSFAETMKQISRIDSILPAARQKCYLSSTAQNFTNQLIDCEDARFTKLQTETLKSELFKKWVDSHIYCNITMAFYMDKSLISEWNALSKSNQEMLNGYFIKVLDASGNHSYLLQLQKTLQLKE